MKLPLLGLAVLRTRSAFLDRSDKTLPQDSQSCFVTCGLVIPITCGITCPPGQVANCSCGGYGPRCICV